MRKRLACVVAVVVAAACVIPDIASADTYPRWFLNIDGGASSSYLQGGANSFGGDSKRTGGALMVSFELQTSAAFGMDFGLNYIEKGADGNLSPPAGDPYNPLPPGTTIVGTTILDYAEFTAFFEALFHPGKRTELIAYTGPVLAYLAEGSFDGTIDGSPQQIDLRSSLSDWSWAFAVGAGYRFDAWKNLRINIDWRVEIGITNMSTTASANYHIEPVANIVTVGLGMPLTGRLP